MARALTMGKESPSRDLIGGTVRATGASAIVLAPVVPEVIPNNESTYRHCEFTTGPVVVTKPATGIRIVEAVRPFYESVRRYFGLAPGEQFGGGAAEPDCRSRFARWSPAETAIMQWYEAVQHQLVHNTTGRAFRHLRDLLAALRINFWF